MKPLLAAFYSHKLNRTASKMYVCGDAVNAFNTDAIYLVELYKTLDCLEVARSNTVLLSDSGTVWSTNSVRSCWHTESHNKNQYKTSEERGSLCCKACVQCNVLLWIKLNAEHLLSLPPEGSNQAV